jgi:hypothetical protein
MPINRPLIMTATISQGRKSFMKNQLMLLYLVYSKKEHFSINGGKIGGFVALLNNC